MKSILRIFLLAVLFVSFYGSEHMAYASSASNDFSQVDAYITETMRILPIKGMALAIVKGDQIIYQQGYGIANAQGDPATSQTPWPMASVTKSFTALAIRQLEAAGKIDMDAPLQTYLPEFRLGDIRAASMVSVRHLFNHSSGISNQEGDQPYLYSRQTTFEQALQQLSHYRPTYQPGEHYEYSNWNYVLLGEVIARASGQSYAEYMQQNILAPLQMSSSGFGDYHSFPRAASCNMIAFGIPVPYDEEYYPVMLSAAHLTTTAEDMAHYLSAFFGQGQYHGENLLPAHTQGWYDPWWNWSYGSPKSDLVYGFSGGHIGVSTSFLLFPGQKVGVVLLLNTRLDLLSPTISSYAIALQIGNIIQNQPYQLLSSRSFYTPWVLLDSFLLLFTAIILWQAARFKNWRNQYQTARAPSRVLAWVGIVFDLLICLGILAFPSLTNATWSILLNQRPDIAIPLLLIVVCLAMLGILKIAVAAWGFGGRKTGQELEA
ncbi:MAG: serine hydrolase [Anaerolineaceae bacterium]|nr:serine hydrolase [Anaerolineaceae bacterium]